MKIETTLSLATSNIYVAVMRGDSKDAPSPLLTNDGSLVEGQGDAKGEAREKPQQYHRRHGCLQQSTRDERNK